MLACAGCRYIDYMLLMTYNYHGSGWEMTTGHHSPILPHRKDPPGDQRELYLVSGPFLLCQSSIHKKWTVSSLSELYSQRVDRFFSVRALFTKSGPFLLCQNSIHKEWIVSSLSELYSQRLDRFFSVRNLTLSETLFAQSDRSTS